MECPKCAAHNRDAAKWCSQCFASFAPLPPAVPQHALSGGPRPLGWTLDRDILDGPLWYMDDRRGREAVVLEGDGSATCYRVSDDAVLFTLERYAAVDHPAYVVMAADGDPKATFVPFDGTVEVRDGTGAPVATLHPSPGGMALFETGGPMMAVCFRQPHDLGPVIDELWMFTLLHPNVVLGVEALMAVPLVCRMLFTRPRQKEQTQIPL